MIWQDFIISVATILFSLSLIYQAFKGFKEKKGFLSIPTSSVTAIALYAISFVYFNLGLYVSAAVSIINGTLWLLLFVQRIIYKKV
jgi:hypothetical protein